MNKINLSEWARIVGVSRQRAHQWDKAGRLPTFIIDGRVYINPDAPKPTVGKIGRPHKTERTTENVQ